MSSPIEKSLTTPAYGAASPSPSQYPSPTSTLQASISNQDPEKQKVADTDEPRGIQLWKTRAHRLWPFSGPTLSRISGTENGDLNRGPFVTEARKLSSCGRGYPRLAAFLDSDENFTIFRRFGYIQTRLLLERQDQLRVLEENLDDFDTKLGQVRPAFLTTRNIKPDLAQKRSELIDKLEMAFCSYASLMKAARDMVALNKPAGKDYRSVKNYIHTAHPLEDPEEAWVLQKEDLITLRPGREHSWLDSSLEYLLKWLHCDFIERLFCSKETKQKTENLTKEDGEIVYYTPSRINSLVLGLIVVALLVLLVVPIYIMYRLDTEMESKRSGAMCILVLLLFTMAFSVVLSLFTRARRHEILGAAAAYCAVMVVFLSNVGPEWSLERSGV